MILCHTLPTETSKVNNKDVNDLIDYSSLQVLNKPYMLSSSALETSNKEKGINS